MNASHTTQPLQQQCYWVTRPAHQGKALCASLAALGARCLHKPTLAIETLPIQVTAPPSDHTLYAIVTSANALPAAQHALQNLPQPARCLAVGPATAEALSQAGLQVAGTAPAPYGGDALLTLPVWQQLASPASLMLFTGAKSSASLIAHLETMGLPLTVHHCYKRSCPTHTLRDLLTPEEQHAITGILCTSRDTLHNLVQIVGKQHGDWLRQTPLLIISDTMRTQARSLGFQTLWQAENATDAAIVARLCQMH